VYAQVAAEFEGKATLKATLNPGMPMVIEETCTGTSPDPLQKAAEKSVFGPQPLNGRLISKDLRHR
jgi:hypothetical protein